MEKKIRIIIEILIVVVLVGYYIVKTVLPELKEYIGSSDRILNYKQYHSMIELKIDDQCDIGFVINSKGVVFHLLFFDKNAVSLYNQNIENHTIEDVVSKSISILVSRQLLVNDSSITIISYDDDSKRFRMALDSTLLKYSISPSIVEEEGDLILKAQEIDSSIQNQKNALEAMDYYSKDMSFGVSSSEKKSVSFQPITFARNVYRKIEDYSLNQNIINMGIDQVIVSIQSFPADSSLQYYPSDNSWYYIQEGRVYAYIEFVQKEEYYGYCFQGSIDDIREGKCES